MIESMNACVLNDGWANDYGEVTNGLTTQDKLLVKMQRAVESADRTCTECMNHYPCEALLLSSDEVGLCIRVQSGDRGQRR